MKTGYKSIEYDEPDNSTYRGIYFSISESGKKDKVLEFSTGDILIDTILFMKAIPDDVAWVSCSSSCDHFYMDGDAYTSFYLHHPTGKVYKDWQDCEKDGISWEDCIEYPCRTEQLESFNSFQDVKEYWDANKPELIKDQEAI